MNCFAEKEYDNFQKEINEVFISLYEICHKIRNIRQLSDRKLSNAASIVLNRVNFYISQRKDEPAACWLRKWKIMRFELDPVDNDELIEELMFIIENDKFRGKLKAQRIGIFRRVFRDDMLEYISKSKSDVYSDVLLKAMSLEKEQKNEKSIFNKYSLNKINSPQIDSNFNAEKLRDFIELIIDPSLLDNGELPSYSRLHTKLQHKYPNRRITSKNTIKKFLNDL